VNNSLSDEEKLLNESEMKLKIYKESKFRYRLYSLIRYLIFAHQCFDEFE